jgi:hypothetical protein
MGLFYAWHREMLKWVKLFNPHGLYSKCPTTSDWKQLRHYYVINHIEYK